MITFFPFDQYLGEGVYEQILTPRSQWVNDDPLNAPTSLVTHGDYIVKRPNGGYIVLSPSEFNSSFKQSSLHPFIAELL